MSDPDPIRLEFEIERLRKALDEETRGCVEARKTLDRANESFEAFVSTAAHDLRESLRDVVSFSQLLAETYAGRLDGDADVLLGKIQQGASKMQSLLADVVDYWAAPTDGLQPSRTDMEMVFDQALLRAAQQITQRSATVTHDPLPPVSGDFETLTKVLHHLIRNAIEYCDSPSPRVHLSSRREGLEWIFSVQDNGSGIEPAFQGRIFGAFKRLHGREYPGNGLGLAFCKKAIEREGGRLWVASTPGEGSTFFFTLPAAE